MVTSSLIEISTGELKKRVVVRGGGRRYSARAHPFLQQTFGQIYVYKDDVKDFLSTPDICFMDW